KYSYIDWYRDHPIADDLRLFRWSEEKLGGAAHVDWKPFDHPQLGPVEIAGFPQWLLWQALLSPRLELLSADALALGEGLWRVRLVVQNTGWLPSYGSKR